MSFISDPLFLDLCTLTSYPLQPRINPPSAVTAVASAALEVTEPLKAAAHDSEISMCSFRSRRYDLALDALKEIPIQSPEGQIIPLSALKPTAIQYLKISPHLKDFLYLLLVKKPLGKKGYHTVLGQLRNLVSKLLLPHQGPNDTLEIQILKSFCNAHFMAEINPENDAKDFIVPLFKRYDPNFESPNFISSQRLEKALATAFKKAGSRGEHCFADWGRKACANMPFLSWNPSTYSIPSRLTDITYVDPSSADHEGAPLNRTIHILRMACPVIGRCGAPEIDPLLLGYLSSLNQYETHLYVNNISHAPECDQRRHGTKKIQAHLENTRAETLRRVAEHPQFRNKFLMISLPHDSDFYAQTGSEDAQVPKEEFINQFMELMTSNAQGFYLPDSIQSIPSLIANIQVELDQLAKTHFVDPTFNLVDRKLFINMAYAIITEIVAKATKTTHLNMTCKDGVDRAMGSTCALIAKMAPTVSPDDLIYYLSMPAVYHHGRPPQEDRTRRSIPAILALYKLGSDGSVSHQL